MDLLNQVFLFLFSFLFSIIHNSFVSYLLILCSVCFIVYFLWIFGFKKTKSKKGFFSGLVFKGTIILVEVFLILFIFWFVFIHFHTFRLFS